MLQSESFKSSPIGKIFVTEEDIDEEDETPEDDGPDIDLRHADARKIVEVSNEVSIVGYT